MSKIPSNKEELLVFEANMDAAMRRFVGRTKMEIISEDPMPFDEIMMREDDGESAETLGDYEMRQRVAGARAFLRFIKREGVDMPSILKQLFAAGRALHDDFFGKLTMSEAALMFSETKAAHSWRCKLLSGQIRLAGMKGVKLPGQKNPEASKAYSAAQKGNQNGRRNKPRQKSFLRKLNATNP